MFVMNTTCFGDGKAHVGCFSSAFTHDLLELWTPNVNSFCRSLKVETNYDPSRILVTNWRHVWKHTKICIIWRVLKWVLYSIVNLWCFDKNSTLKASNFQVYLLELSFFSNSFISLWKMKCFVVLKTLKYNIHVFLELHICIS